MINLSSDIALNVIVRVCMYKLYSNVVLDKLVPWNSHFQQTSAAEHGLVNPGVSTPFSSLYVLSSSSFHKHRRYLSASAAVLVILVSSDSVTM